MSSEVKFSGFSEATFQFFEELRRTNEKAWFDKNRERFENEVMLPAQVFVVELGKRLEQIAPDVVAIPKIDKSIFRLHRDVRFSNDKTPYKTHLAMLFWEGPKKKMENPGFYVHLEPGKLFLGGGMHVFPKEFIPVYRDAVVHPKQSKALVAALDKVRQHPDLKLGKPHYKKTPRGYDADHPNADLLLYNGLAFYYESKLVPQVYSDKLLDFCFTKFEAMLPLHAWLREINQ